MSGIQGSALCVSAEHVEKFALEGHVLRDLGVSHNYGLSKACHREYVTGAKLRSTSERFKKPAAW